MYQGVIQAVPVEPSAFASELPALDFRTLFESEYTYVRTSIRRLGVRERELPDLIHDVFFAVHRKLSDFDRTKPVRPWLFGITFRVVVGHKRKLGYRREELAASDSLDPVDETPGIDQQIEDEERRQMVHEALNYLDDAMRAVFVMHELDDLAMKDIALALDLPLNTAYSRLRLAREDFRHAVERIVRRRSRAAFAPVANQERGPR